MSARTPGLSFQFSGFRCSALKVSFFFISAQAMTSILAASFTLILVLMPGSRYQSNPKQKLTRFALNVGRRQGILPQGLIGAINRVPGVGRIKVGKIEILRNKALIEADSRFTPQILAAFQDTEINGKTVTIKVAPGYSSHTRRMHPHKKRKAT